MNRTAIAVLRILTIVAIYLAFTAYIGYTRGVREAAFFGATKIAEQDIIEKAPDWETASPTFQIAVDAGLSAGAERETKSTAETPVPSPTAVAAAPRSPFNQPGPCMAVQYEAPTDDGIYAPSFSGTVVVRIRGLYSGDPHSLELERGTGDPTKDAALLKYFRMSVWRSSNDRDCAAPPDAVFRGSDDGVPQQIYLSRTPDR